jgi:hypothetical protein
MTSRTPQCEVFWALLSNSKHSGVLEDSKSPNFGSVGLHPHTWPKWGCDINHVYDCITKSCDEARNYMINTWFDFKTMFNQITKCPKVEKEIIVKKFVD